MTKNIENKEAVPAIYDGHTLQFESEIEVKTLRKVLVTFLDETGDSPEPLEAKFERLFQSWYDETAYYSSGHILFRHPAFQEIVQLGKPAIPMILKKAQEKHPFICAALSQIVGESPVPR